VYAIDMVESGKTGRVLLCWFPSSFLQGLALLAHPRAGALDRLCLFRRDWSSVSGLDDEEELSSEITRARENPHMLHDAVAVVGPRCVQRHCSGFVDVLRPVVACC
jgi:hypothetical protein